jgi:hypothetical protein
MARLHPGPCRVRLLVFPSRGLEFTIASIALFRTTN